MAHGSWLWLWSMVDGDEMTVAVAPARSITPEEQATAHELLERARGAMRAAECLDQAAVDRLCRAIAWAGGNEETATRLAAMGGDGSGMGSPQPERRAQGARRRR